MQTVATNIRFPKQDYEELKAMARDENVSLASFINTAVQQYKMKKLSFNRKARLRLFEKMKSSKIKIDVSTVDLVRLGRRFG